MIKKYNTLVIAHRGFSGRYPENTLIAIEEAFKYAQVVEIDVQLSKDNIPVVFHDTTLKRTTNGTGKVKEKTLKELKELDAGLWFSENFRGTKIPTLEEVLLLTKDKVILNIEIKKSAVSKKYPYIEYKVIELVNKHKMNDQVILSSFSTLALKRIKQINPQIKTALITRARLIDNSIMQAKKLGVYSINDDKRFFKRKIIEKSHKNNLNINVYTINKKREMIKFIKKGVNGIFTDYPDILIQALDELNLNNKLDLIGKIGNVIKSKIIILSKKK